MPLEINNKDAAEKFNVSERLVKTGKQVLNNGIPELTAKVESGQVRVSTAADIATLPPGQQDIIVGLNEQSCTLFSTPAMPLIVQTVTSQQPRSWAGVSLLLNDPFQYFNFTPR